MLRARCTSQNEMSHGSSDFGPLTVANRHGYFVHRNRCHSRTDFIFLGAGTRNYFKTNFIHYPEVCWTTGVEMLIPSPFILILFINIATHCGGWRQERRSILLLQQAKFTSFPHTCVAKCIVSLKVHKIWQGTFFSPQRKCDLFKVLWGKKMKDARWQMLSAHCLANMLNKYHKPAKPLSTGTHSTEAQSRKTIKELGNK